jgi:hypothetical protein
METIKKALHFQYTEIIAKNVFITYNVFSNSDNKWASAFLELQAYVCMSTAISCSVHYVCKTTTVSCPVKAIIRTNMKPTHLAHYLHIPARVKCSCSGTHLMSLCVQLTVPYATKNYHII